MPNQKSSKTKETNLLGQGDVDDGLETEGVVSNAFETPRVGQSVEALHHTLSQGYFLCKIDLTHVPKNP